MATTNMTPTSTDRVDSLSSCSARQNRILSKIPTSRFMKQELPIAIALLATGLLLWITKSASTSDAMAAGKPATGHAISAATDSQDVATVGDVQANQILAQLAANFRDGPSRQGRLHIQSQLFGKFIEIEGRFWLFGQGSNKSRIELIPNSLEPTKITQLCDGRFCYRLTQTNQQQKLSFCDLSSIEGSLPATRRHWVPTTSVDRLFSFLASSFRFRLQASKQDPASLHLAGTWIPEDLAKLMIDHVDHRLIVPKVDYQKLPPQIPHAVRVHLKRDTFHQNQWAPLSVEFLQINPDSPAELQSVMSIRFDSVQPGPGDTSLFQMENVTGRSVDVSPRYSRRFEVMFGKERVADTNAAAEAR